MLSLVLGKHLNKLTVLRFASLQRDDDSTKNWDKACCTVAKTLVIEVTEQVDTSNGRYKLYRTTEEATEEATEEHNGH